MSIFFWQISMNNVDNKKTHEWREILMRKNHLLQFMMIALFAIVLAACGGSDGTSNDASEASSEAEKSEAVNEDDAEASDDIDMEEVQEELNIDMDEDAEMPQNIPSDVPLPDDMEVVMTVDNDMVAQFNVHTAMTIEELEELYLPYLNSDIFSGEPEQMILEDDDYYVVEYSTEYNGDGFEVTIIEEEDYRDLHILVRYN